MKYLFAGAVSAVCFALICVSAAATPVAAMATAPIAGEVSARDAGNKTLPAAEPSGADAVAAAVKSKFSERFSAPVTAVRRTPYGLFEVQLGMDLVYTDEGVTWVMQGPLIDALTRRDLTEERLQQLSHVDFDQLPLELAVKEVKGGGKRRIAVFADPNCGYCKQLHKTLEKVDDLTVYTFLIPILTPDSKTKVKNVWCAANRAQVWGDWMGKGTTPPPADCDDVPIDQSMDLARKLMVKGTPAIFFTDGSRADGAVDLAQLTERLK